ncbi:MAG: hypothetical protein RL173_2214, partial [Fibrobacterota bacterium]
MLFVAGAVCATVVEDFSVDSTLNLYSGYASDLIKVTNNNGQTDGNGLFGTGKRVEILGDGVTFLNGLRARDVLLQGKTFIHGWPALIVRSTMAFNNGQAKTSSVTGWATIGGTVTWNPTPAPPLNQVFNNSQQGYEATYPGTLGPGTQSRILELEDTQLPGYADPVGYAPPANVPNLDMNIGNGQFVAGGQFRCVAAMVAQGFNASDYCNGDTVRAYNRTTGQNNYFGDIIGLNQARVLLGEGVYFFRNLTGNQPSVVAAQPNKKRTVIYLSQGFNPAQTGRVFVGPASAYNFTSGQGKTTVCDTVETANCSFGGTVLLISKGPLVFPRDSPIWATVSVPRNNAFLSQQFQLFGQVFADTLLGAQEWKFTAGKYIPFNPVDPVVSVTSINKLSVKELTETGCTARLGRPCRDTVVTVRMDHVNPYPVTMDYDLIAFPTGVGMATEGSDFVKVASGKLTIAVRSLSANLTLSIFDDNLYEGPEDFRLVLRNLQGASFAGANGKPDTSIKSLETTVTIVDNETPPVASFAKTTDTIAEGASKQLKVKLSFAIGRPLSVEYAVVPNAGFTAQETSDFVVLPNPKTVVFASGSDTASITASVVNDLLFEYPERFSLQLRNPSLSEVTVDPVRGRDTILIPEDDPRPVLTINDTTLLEGQSAILRASLKGVPASGDSACFDWKTLDSTAFAGSDYTTDSGHACIAAGQNSVALKTLRALTDGVYELPETFRVQLKPGFGLDASPDRFGRVTILNTNPRPTIRIDDVSAKRPATGTVVYSFKVHLIDTAGKPTVTGVNSTVAWKTLSGTALAGLDFDSAAGSFTFSASNPADSVKTISVVVRGSSVYHANDLRFTVNLTVNQYIDTTIHRKKTVGIGSIASAVGAPRIVWVGDTVAEGSNGQRTAIRFTASLQDSVGNPTTSRDPVVFVWSTQDSTARSASPDTHFVSRANVVVTIPAGSQSKLDSVMVIGNDLYQAPLRILLSNISNSDPRAAGYNKSASTVRALGGIQDADIAPVVQDVVGPALVEGNAGTKPFAFILKLDRPSGLPVQFSWMTISGGSATAGSDFTAVSSTTRTIQPGVVADTFSVLVNGDPNQELDETFAVVVTPTSGLRSVAPDTGLATIINDDGRPLLRLQLDSNVVEGNSGTHPLTFKLQLLDSATGAPLTLANASNLPVRFWWRTAPGTASSTDNDYVGQAGRWDTVQAGQLSKSLSIQVRGDTRFETDESIRFLVDSVRNAVIVGNNGIDTGWILNDDDQPAVVVLDTSVQEPAVYGATASMVFRVKLSSAAGVPVRVGYETVPHSARGTTNFSVEPWDYLESDSGAFLVFPADTVLRTISVPVYGDTLYEKSQDFYLQLLNSTNSVISRNRATGVILDADTAPAIRIYDADAVVEGAKSSFTVRLDRPSEVAVGFRLRTRNGSATASEDFIARDTVYSMPLYSLNLPISVQSLRDAMANEFTENFRVAMTEIVDAFPADTSGAGYIVDANAKPYVVIDSIAPVDEADTTIHFTVRLSEASAVAVDLRFRTMSGTAAANKDFVDTTGLFRIPAKALSARLPIRILSDRLDEETPEWFYVRLDSAANRDYASVRDSLGRAGILDDDPPPSIFVTNASVNEPVAASATTSAIFTVRLDAPSAKTVTVSWRTIDSTAKVLEKDYAAGSGSVVFAPGDTVKTISVTIVGDSLDEYDEHFGVSLASPTNAIFGDSIGVGTIVDTDDPPFLRINDASVREGTNVQIRMVFTATLERPSAKAVAFHWATRDSSARSDGLVASGTLDFVAASGDITIPAGSKSAQIQVLVNSDGWGESPEAFSVILSPSSNIDKATSDTIGYGTILDGNGRPAVYIDSVAPVHEADSTITFHVRLQFPRDTVISVRFATFAGTAASNEEFRDTAGVVLFSSGELTKDIQVRILEDRFNEPDSEWFQLRLIGADSANIADSTGLATILDDDLPPVASITDASILEPAAFAATDSLRLRISLSALSKVPSSVEWRTLDSTATSPLDFLFRSGTVVFQSDDSVMTIFVPVLGDSLDEYDERLQVRLSNSVESALGDSIGDGTILDNDTAPAVHVVGVRLAEPSIGSTRAVFRLRLDRPSAKPISFDWGTSPGTATPGLDYTTASGHVDLGAGMRDSSVSVFVLADSIAGEGDETYRVRLSSLINTIVGDTSATGVIEDLQGLPGVSIYSIPAVEEDDSTLHFVVKLNWYPANPVRVWLHTKPGSATPGIRYVDTAGSILFPAGARIDSFPVRILNDRIAERIPETFFMELDSAKMANIIDPVGTATLLDDGDNPPVVIDDADTVTEGGKAMFRVRLTGRTKDTVWVWWKTLDGTATRASGDYRTDSGMLVFAPGTMQLYAEVPALTDSVWEPVESFHVYMSRVDRGIRSTDSIATGWIRDDGVPPRLSFATPDTSVVEDAAGDVPVRITLDRAASVPLKVRVLTRSTSTATRGKDYDLRDLSVDTLTIPVGAKSVVFHARVVADSIDEFDETVDMVLEPVAPASTGSRATTRLTILDDDAAPALVFSLDTQIVREDVGSVRVSAKLARISEKPIYATYHVAGSATPSVDHDLPTGQRIGFSFAPGIDTASIVFGVIDDNIRELTESVDLVLDSAHNATLVAGRTRQVVLIIDNDSAPVVGFAARDTTVPEDVGVVSLRLVLSNPSAIPVRVGIRAAGTATLDSLRPGSDALLDSTKVYELVVPPMATEASFSVRILDDGRVEPVEWIDLSMVTLDSTGRAGTGEKISVLDNDKNPLVEITRPTDSVHVADPRQIVSWTVDGRPMPDSDTLVVQGWNTIVRVFVDTAGNRGADSILVWGDFTPPSIQVFKITGPNTHDPSKDTTWWGDKARTRFGKDTIWYWVRDSIQNADGKTWRVVVDTHSVTTDFKGDGLFPTQVRACDSVGNCAVDTGWIDLKQSVPVVNILTPPDGSQAVAGTLPVIHQVTDLGKTWDLTSTKTISTPGIDTILRCYEDDVGNRGCDAHKVVVKPVQVISATYLDLNGDGRVDAVLVNLDSRWSADSLPSFDLMLNDSVRTGQKPNAKTPYYAGPSRGTPIVNGKDTTWVSVGTYLLDSAGHILKGTDGFPLTNVLGDTVFGTDGKPKRDSLGRILYKVPGSGQVDSTRLLVSIVPPFPFGMTGFDVLQGAKMVASWTTKDSTGKPTVTKYVDAFKVDEKVPPVIVKAEIHRVENYTDPDTLFVTASEYLRLGKGGDLLQVGSCGAGIKTCAKADLIWKNVPDSMVTRGADGRYWFLVYPTDMGIKPDYQVRFRSDISDLKGNVIDTTNLNWSTVVSGAPRPDLVIMDPPSRIPSIPGSERDRTGPGGILIRTTKGVHSSDNKNKAWWEPGTGYVTGGAEMDRVRSICPNEQYCNGPTVYVNRPARMIMYIYDLAGTFVMTRTINISKDDLAKMEPDQLDRVSIELDWNHRN